MTNFAKHRRLKNIEKALNAIPDPEAEKKSQEEMRWAATLVAATPDAHERPVTWQARTLDMTPQEWRRHRKAVVPGSTFAKILAVLDEMSAPDFDDAAFDAL